MLSSLTIRTKIILAQICLVAMVSVFIYTYYPNKQKQAAILAIEYKIESINNMFAIGVGIGMGDVDIVAVSEALEWAHSDSSVVYISVFNNHNQKIASFNPRQLTVPAGIEKSGPDISLDGSEIKYYKSDIDYQNLSFGKLVIGYSLQNLKENLHQLKVTTLYFCISLFGTGVVFSIIIGNMITQNIRKLDNTVKRISNGDENVYVTIDSKDEIGEFGKAFNHMLHRVERSRKELIRYSEQLKKQNEELNQFSYVVSHDLKAPLRAIYKLSQWIEEDAYAVLPGEAKANMDTLRSRVFRLESLINGLLEYSKIGRINIPLERVNVNLLIQETIDLLNPPDNITLHVQPGMPTLQTKKILLQQVFMNLISNAIKYNDKPEGIIHITAEKTSGHFRFAVADNGMGIDPAYHKKIFMIFQTLEARDKIEGTGVGLSIIKKCVEDMGGEIYVTSAEGKGARFEFTWPSEEVPNEEPITSN